MDAFDLGDTGGMDMGGVEDFGGGLEAGLDLNEDVAPDMQQACANKTDSRQRVNTFSCTLFVLQLLYITGMAPLPIVSVFSAHVVKSISLSTDILPTQLFCSSLPPGRTPGLHN